MEDDSLVNSEIAKHRTLLFKSGVSASALANVSSRGSAPQISPRVPSLTGVRVLCWNFLADGLADDGFTVRDVLAGGTPTDTDKIVAELMKTKRSGGDIEAFKAKHCTERTGKNLAAIIDWPTRWARMRVIIERLQPDVIAVQELDHFAECSADLRALGFECSVRQPASAYKPAHATGIDGAGLDDVARYAKHLESLGMAFAPTVISNARQYSLKAGRDAPDDDGVAIFWRSSALEGVDLSFLPMKDAKRCRAVVRVGLKRKSDSAQLSVICAHLPSGTKAEDEASRLESLTAPSFDAAARQWAGPSLLAWLRDSVNAGPTVFCLDANSAPSRDEPKTVWRALRQLMPCVWDDHFDATGKPTGSGVAVTSNKLRGPESDQLKKIGEHICLVSL